MFKAISVVDLHTDNFHRFNETPLFRLNQFVTLGSRIVELAEEEGASEVWYGGDLINSAFSSQLVMSILKDHMDIIREAGLLVRVIYGQHDSDERVISKRGSYISLLEGDNFIYMDDKFLEIEGKRVYFRNYQSIEYIDPPECDVFVSHVSLGYGQKVNKDKFKLGIFGDIHESFDDGHIHMVGPPIQHHADEPKTGWLGVISLPDCTFKRVETNNENYQFLQFDPPIKKEKKQRIAEAETHFHELDLKEELEKEGLTAIHSKLPIEEVPNIIDFDFHLERLVVENYRSIQRLELNYTKKDKIIFFQGENGSGKSSTLMAQMDALCGNKKLIDEENDFDDSDVFLLTELAHNGNQYQIQRRVGKTKFFINGRESESRKKRDIEAEIRHHLPFIDYLNWFHITSGTHFFDNIDRITWINTCFNLPAYDYFAEVAKEYKSKVEFEISRLTSEKTNLVGRLDQINSNLKTNNHKLEERKLVDISQEKSLQDMMVKRKELGIKISRLSGIIEGYVRDYKRIKEEVSSVSEVSKEEMEEVISKWDDITEIPSKERIARRGIENIDRKLKDTISCPSCKTDFLLKENKEELNEKRKSFEFELIELKKLDRTEPTVSRREALNHLANLQNIEEKKLKMIEVKEKGKSDAKEKKALQEELDNLKFTDPEIHAMLSLIIEKKTIQNQVDKDKENKKKINIRGKELISELKMKRAEVEDLKRYIDLFDLKVVNSIPFRLLNQVGESISTDRIKFTTTDQNKNGDYFVNISCALRQGERWRNYDDASDGEKVRMDLYILDRLLELMSGLGILIIDEGLGSLDYKKYEGAGDVLRNLQVNSLLLSSHHPGFNIYDRKITFLRPEDENFSQITEI